MCVKGKQFIIIFALNAASDFNRWQNILFLNYSLHLLAVCFILFKWTLIALIGLLFFVSSLVTYAAALYSKQFYTSV